MARMGFENVWAFIDGAEMYPVRATLDIDSPEEATTVFGGSDWRAALVPDTVRFTVSGSFMTPGARGGHVERWVVPSGVPWLVAMPARHRRYWVPLWEVLTYSREPGGPVLRAVHRRWWFVSHRVVLWWLRRLVAGKP